MTSQSHDTASLAGVGMDRCPAAGDELSTNGGGNGCHLRQLSLAKPAQQRPGDHQGKIKITHA